MGEDQNQVALQQQHKAFVQVHRNLKEAKRTVSRKYKLIKEERKKFFILVILSI